MFIRGIVRLALLFACVGALAEQPDGQRVPLVAIVTIGDLSRPPFMSLVEGLRAAGYEAGKNIEILPPAAASRGYAALEPLAAAAVTKRADVIFAFGDTAVHAAKAATRSIPIVMAVNTDPIERGLVKNLARPEANVTGLFGNAQMLVAKRIQLLRELAPGTRRLGVLVGSGSESGQLALKQIQATAAKFNLAVETAQISKREEQDAALRALAAKRVDALIYTPSLLYDLPAIVRWAAERKVAVVYAGPNWVRDGGLISYSSDQPALLLRAVDYIARILKGAKVSELPVEQLEKYELAINLKTAKALGLKVPQSLLTRADEVIQ